MQQASMSLVAYASGLLNFMLIKSVGSNLYSRQDTKTPVKYGIIAMVTNMVFNAIFAYFYGYIEFGNCNRSVSLCEYGADIAVYILLVSIKLTRPLYCSARAC
ncbi:hypothetical protein OH492_23635 [Vibrio chagasii]|nr:hypothetical protein [Vibrio chagasii]